MSPHRGGVTTEGGDAAVSFYISLFCVKKKKKKENGDDGDIEALANLQPGTKGEETTS